MSSIVKSNRYVLTKKQWSERHGIAVEDGRLRAESDTDYLYFFCSGCGIELKGGAGIGFEGWTEHNDGIPVALCFRIDCFNCGFRDYFKIPVDERGRYGTAKVGENPTDWPRPGSVPCGDEE